MIWYRFTLLFFVVVKLVIIYNKTLTYTTYYVNKGMVNIKKLNKDVNKYPKLGDTDGYFYIIKMDNGNIKVGISQSIGKRLMTYFSTGSCGNDVIRYKIYPVHKYKLLEKCIKNYFNRFVIKGEEWFGNLEFDEVSAYAEKLIKQSNLGININELNTVKEVI